MSSKRFIANLVFRSDLVDCIGVRMAIIELNCICKTGFIFRIAFWGHACGIVVVLR